MSDVVNFDFIGKKTNWNMDVLHNPIHSFNNKHLYGRDITCILLRSKFEILKNKHFSPCGNWFASTTFHMSP